MDAADDGADVPLHGRHERRRQQACISANATCATCTTAAAQACATAACATQYAARRPARRRTMCADQACLTAHCAAELAALNTCGNACAPRTPRTSPRCRSASASTRCSSARCESLTSGSGLEKHQSVPHRPNSPRPSNRAARPDRRTIACVVPYRARSVLATRGETSPSLMSSPARSTSRE